MQVKSFSGDGACVALRVNVQLLPNKINKYSSKKQNLKKNISIKNKLVSSFDLSVEDEVIMTESNVGKCSMNVFVRTRNIFLPEIMEYRSIDNWTIRQTETRKTMNLLRCWKC